MGVVEPRRLAGHLAIDQLVLTLRVELHHRVPYGLERHASDPGRFGAACVVVNRSQGKQSLRLQAVLLRRTSASTCEASQSGRSGIAMANLLRSPC